MILIKNEIYTKREINKAIGEIKRDYREHVLINEDIPKNNKIVKINKKDFLNYIKFIKNYKNVKFKIVLDKGFKVVIPERLRNNPTSKYAWTFKIDKIERK